MIRLRLREMLTEKGITAYALARDAGDSVSDQVVYRLLRNGGKVNKYISAALLESACRVLNCTPGELIEIVPDPDKPKKKG